MENDQATTPTSDTQTPPIQSNGGASSDNGNNSSGCDYKTRSPFKNLNEAKKRLQAFKSNSIILSPLVKKSQNLQMDEMPDARKFTDDELDEKQFKRVDKKSRNYRIKRSITPDKKKSKKYPKDWNEMNDMDINLKNLQDIDMIQTKNNLNDLRKQLLFESPSIPIQSFKCKMINRDDRLVPFEYVRYTNCKPPICYSSNLANKTPPFLSRKEVFDVIPSKHSNLIEDLYRTMTKFIPLGNSPKKREWYPKYWVKCDLNECKLLENSVGLSFLQNYSDDDNDDDLMGKNEKKLQKKLTKSKKKKKKHMKRKKKRKRKSLDNHTMKKDKLKKKNKKSDTLNEFYKTEFVLESNKKKQRKSSSGNTPDTDEYHSLWESEEEIQTLNEQNKRLITKTRSWESDEEMFERTTKKIVKKIDNFENLEIPLNIKPFSRRAYDAEEKILQKEKRALSEERKLLELEKKKIRELEEKIRMAEMKMENAENHGKKVLENEYEEFMKSLDTQDKNVDTSDTDFSITASPEITTSSKMVKSGNAHEFDIKSVKEVLPPELIDNQSALPLDILLPGTIFQAPPPPPPPPLPVPVPSPKLAVTAPDEGKEKDKPFIFSSITLPNRKTLLNTNLNLDDDSNSTDFTEKFAGKKDEDEAEPDEKTTMTPPQPSVEETIKSTDDVKIKKSSPNRKESPVKRAKRSRSRSRSRDRRKRRRHSTPTRRQSPPSTRRARNDYGSRRRHNSPRRRGGKAVSPPGRRRGSTPSSRRRHHTPPRRSPTPPLSTTSSSQRHRRNSRSPLSVGKCGNSPLDGFRRSVADSTISDDMLPQSTSGGATCGIGDLNMSPKRISLDDRINQVLGLEKMHDDMKHEHYYPHHHHHPDYDATNMHYAYDAYGNYLTNCDTYDNVGNTSYGMTSSGRTSASNRVVQIGNILEVVPTEELPPPPQMVSTKPPDMVQKIVQVGNVLRIVPGNALPADGASYTDLTTPTNTTEKHNADYEMMRQKSAERKAEREKRRLERELRRKEKERKRKEKEKRKQLKLKLKTENLIKKALQMDPDIGGQDVDDDVDEPTIPVVISNTITPNKGILISTLSKTAKIKCVQFADGIRPGEGTSPSGGEEFTSPPPIRLPKEKRYGKSNKLNKKKKKVRVKVVKRSESDSDEEYYENLPPPPPPPGSPPPHLFPPRLKTHTLNNMHFAYNPAMPYGAPPSTPTGVGTVAPPPPSAVPRVVVAPTASASSSTASGYHPIGGAPMHHPHHPHSHHHHHHTIGLTAVTAIASGGALHLPPSNR